MILFTDEVIERFVREKIPFAPRWVRESFCYMATHVSERFSLDELACRVGISKFSLCRGFQRMFAVPPFEWLWQFRVVLAAELLRLPVRWDVQQIGFKCGFASSAHFSRAFKRVYGMTPGAYRRMSSDQKFESIEPPSLDGIKCQIIRAAFEKVWPFRAENQG